METGHLLCLIGGAPLLLAALALALIIYSGIGSNLPRLPIARRLLPGRGGRRGVTCPAIASMLWAEYTSRPRAIRLHLCFELNRMIPAQFLVDTGKSNEKKALLPSARNGT